MSHSQELRDVVQAHHGLPFPWGTTGLLYIANFVIFVRFKLTCQETLVYKPSKNTHKKLVTVTVFKRNWR